MDAAIQPYLPEYPQRKWLKRVVLAALLVMVLGSFGYGIPVIRRAYRVQDSQENHSQEIAVNRLWTLVANGNWRDESAVGRLARKLIELKEEPYATAPLEGSEPVSAKTALEHYRVHSGEFSVAAHDIGWTILQYKEEGKTYPSYDAGNFEPEFIDKTLEATPRNLPNMLWSPPEPIRGYGNYRWQWLLIGLAALWAFFTAIGLLLLRHRRIWQVQAEYRFKAGLSQESYDILHLIKQITSHPTIKPHEELLRRTHALLMVTLEDSNLSRQEVKAELASLGATYRAQVTPTTPVPA